MIAIDENAPGPLDVDAGAFEQLVVDELDRLPDDMVDGLDNVVFVVEDRPEDGSLDLLGLYDGWALTERERYGSAGELPDRLGRYQTQPVGLDPAWEQRRTAGQHHRRDRQS